MSLDDKYTYPDSGGVLKNKLDITDGAILDETMNELASAAWAELSTEPTASFDFAYLRRIHTVMFSDLFGWAGQVRDVDTVAGNTGLVYARPRFIDSGLDDMFAALKRDDYLLGITDSDEFATKLSTHWGYLTQIHPFRDGNTRSQSLFVSNLARAAGHPLAWNRIDVDSLRSARLQAMRGDESALRSCLLTSMVGGGPGSFAVMPAFRIDSGNTGGVAATVTAGRCGRPRHNGKGLCMRRVGDGGCPYHG